MRLVSFILNSAKRFRLAKRVYLLLNKPDWITGIEVSNIESMFSYMKNKGSIVRFGDGEFAVMRGEGIPFQPYSEKLKKDLIEVFTSNCDRLMVCIPRQLCIDEDFYSLTVDSAFFWSRVMHHHTDWLRRQLKHTQCYGNSEISRPWMPYHNLNRAKWIFDNFKTLFSNRNIVIIEGEYTRFGCKNDLLNKAKQVSRIICPSVNAYEKIEVILSEAKKSPKDSLLITCLGPTAKVVTYQLVKSGYQVLDLGHLDVEYEWFLRRDMKKELISGKFVNEHKSRIVHYSMTDKDYEKQIVVRIT